MNPALTESSIHHVIARRNGIPQETVRALIAGVEDMVTNLVEALQRKLVGQARPFALIQAQFRQRLSASKLEAAKRPTVILYFLGPSGVGKTETAKIIADQFAGPGGLTQVDLSQYTQPHQVATLFGAPPGYVGYDKAGGVLTKDAAKKPNRVFLFDEADKAHPDVTERVLLPLLGEGVIQGGDGTTIDASRSIVIFTSNLGADGRAKAPIGIGRDTSTAAGERRLIDVVKSELSAPLRARIDAFIVFQTLTEAAVIILVEREIARLSSLLALGPHEIPELHQDERRVPIVLSTPAREHLLCRAAAGAKAEGARGVQKVTNELLLDPVSELRSRAALAGGKITIDLQEGELAYQVTQVTS